MKLRNKLLWVSIFVAFFIAGIFGFSLYKIAMKKFTDSFLASKLTLARTIAASIDPGIHASLANAEAKENPEYQRYLKYFNSILKNEPFVTYIYSLYYNPEINNFIYVLDGKIGARDKIWVETNDFAFEVYFNEQGQVQVDFNQKSYTQKLELRLDDKNYGALDIRQNGTLFEVYLDSHKILSFEKAESLKVVTPAGTLDYNERYFETEIEYAGTKGPINFYLTVKGESESDPGTKYVNTDDIKKAEIDLFLKNEDIIDQAGVENIYGKTLTARGIIRNPDGSPSGIVIVELYEKNLQEFRESFLATAIAVILPVTLFIMLLVYLVAERIILQPLQKIMNRVKEIESGNLNSNLVITTKDEFQDLANNLNVMSAVIKSQTDHLELQAESFERFVPKQFLNQIGKDSIPQVHLGDSIEKEMTILFADIRSFTTISEKMQPGELFQYLNSYLGKAGPIIRANGGFIDKYIGDAIMALFPENPMQAVKAGIELLEAVAQYNQDNLNSGKPELRIGIGVHTGKLMLGTIGENERMDGTVIADAVNAASRIEQLTRKYNAEFLVSGTVAELTKEQYHHRFIDSVVLTGKQEVTEIFEVLGPA